MTLKGIDVSVWNGAPDWAKVKQSGVQFAILRAGYGRLASQKDNQFDRNYSECKAKGIPIGIYWYNYAKTVEDAEKEADACLSVIKGKSFEYPVFYDIEEASVAATGKENVKAITRAFLKKIKAAGYKIGVYGGQYFANGAVLDLASEYDIWMPDYRANAAQYHYEEKFAMWQYSSTGKIDGINGNVDVNYCYKDFIGQNKPAQTTGSTQVKNPASIPVSAPEVKYRAYTGKWWGEITNCNDTNSMGYAGVENLAIKGFSAKATKGTLRYRVHTIGGKWLGWISKSDINDWNYGIAGVTYKDIDGLQMELTGVDGYAVQYRVSTVGSKNYLNWITNYGTGDMGYAGIYGKQIDKIQVKIVKK